MPSNPFKNCGFALPPFSNFWIPLKSRTELPLPGEKIKQRDLSSYEILYPKDKKMMSNHRSLSMPTPKCLHGTVSRPIPPTIVLSE